MLTYTAFCRDLSDANSTTWIETIEAPGETAARVKAVAECAKAWGYTGDNVDDIECIGLAEPLHGLMTGRDRVLATLSRPPFLPLQPPSRKQPNRLFPRALLLEHAERNRR